MENKFTEISELLFDTKVNMSVSRRSRVEIEMEFERILRKNFDLKINTDSRGQGQRELTQEEWDSINNPNN